MLRAQRSALGAEHGYALALGDVLHHMHLPLIPRYATTPLRLRGRGAWDATPEEMLPEAEHAASARKLMEGLRAV